jgi:hypothetical protein
VYVYDDTLEVDTDTRNGPLGGCGNGNDDRLDDRVLRDVYECDDDGLDDE